MCDIFLYFHLNNAHATYKIDYFQISKYSTMKRKELVEIIKEVGVNNSDLQNIIEQKVTTDLGGADDGDVRDKVNKLVYVIDISCPMEANVWNKEVEKVAKYGPLKEELQRMWNCRGIVVPVVVGCLGAVSKNIEKHLLNIPGCPTVKMCQKICLLGSKRILKDALARR